MAFNIDLPDFGGQINSLFFGTTNNWPQMMLQMLMFFLAVSVFFGIFFYLYKLIVIYKRKVFVIDTYYNKVKIDRVGLVKIGSNELLRFLYDRSLSLPNKIPTDTWIKYGPNKEEVFPAYFKNPEDAKVVKLSIRKWYNPNRWILGNPKPPKQIVSEVNKMIADKILIGIDNNAKNVVNLTWRESAKKYMQPSMFDKYGPVIISGMMLVLLIFSWIVVTQQMTDAMGLTSNANLALAEAMETFAARGPPPP